MGSRKTRNAVTSEERAQIRRDANELFVLCGKNKTRAAELAGTSRQAFGKWMEGLNLPSNVNLRGLHSALEARRKANEGLKESAARAQVADHVRSSVTKVATVHPLPLATDGKPGLASTSLRGERIPAKKQKGQRRMGALLARATAGVTEEPAYVVELEVCLYYHREDIAHGELSQTVISAAREGHFETAGCATWSAKRWWDELVERDKGLRESMQLRVEPRRDDIDDDDDMTN